MAERAYFGGNRSQLAWEYGRLLSYPDEAIRRLISDNPETARLLIPAGGAPAAPFRFFPLDVAWISCYICIVV